MNNRVGVVPSQAADFFGADKLLQNGQANRNQRFTGFGVVAIRRNDVHQVRLNDFAKLFLLEFAKIANRASGIELDQSAAGNKLGKPFQAVFQRAVALGVRQNGSISHLQKAIQPLAQNRKGNKGGKIDQQVTSAGKGAAAPLAQGGKAGVVVAKLMPKEKFQVGVFLGGVGAQAFKRALGHLLKEGKIEQRDGWTYLRAGVCEENGKES